MKYKLGGLGLVVLSSSIVVAACSSDDTGEFEPAPNVSGSNTGGAASGGSSAQAGTAGSGSSAGGMVSTAGTGGAASTAGVAGGGASGNGGTTPVAGGGGDGGVGGEGGLGGAISQGGAPAEGGAGFGGDGAGGAGGEGTVVQPISCDFTEVENGQTQSTGLSTEGSVKVLCGKLDVGNFNANEKIVDRDRYSINVANDNVVVKVELASLNGFSKVELKLDNEVRVLSQTTTVLNIPSVFANGVLLSITAYADTDAPVAVPYQISVLAGALDSRCAAGQGAAAYTEAADGNDSRGNDVYTIKKPTVTLTAANDAAEATNLTVGKSSYLIKGVGADVSRVEDYTDSDSYAFRTGPSTTQVTLRADWSGNKDLDVWVFPAGSTEPVGYGALFSNSSPDWATVKVQPNTDYIAFVGYKTALTKPFDYSLTLCGESYGLK